MSSPCDNCGDERDGRSVVSLKSCDFVDNQSHSSESSEPGVLPDMPYQESDSPEPAVSDISYLCSEHPEATRSNVHSPVPGSLFARGERLPRQAGEVKVVREASAALAVLKFSVLPGGERGPVSATPKPPMELRPSLFGVEPTARSMSWDREPTTRGRVGSKASLLKRSRSTGNVLIEVHDYKFMCNISDTREATHFGTQTTSVLPASSLRTSSRSSANDRSESLLGGKRPAADGADPAHCGEDDTSRSEHADAETRHKSKSKTKSARKALSKFVARAMHW